MKKLFAITALAALVATGSAFSGQGTAPAATDNPRACLAAENMSFVGPPDTVAFPNENNAGMFHAMTVNMKNNTNGNDGMLNAVITSMNNKSNTPLNCPGFPS